MKRLIIPSHVLNPEILKWAMNRKGMTIDEIARRSKVDVSKLQLFFEGKDAKLTLRQLERIVRALRIPYGYFLLREIPREPEIDIPDLRNNG